VCKNQEKEKKMKKRKISSSFVLFLGISISLLALGVPNTRSATIQLTTEPSDEPRIIGIGSPGEVVEREVLQMRLNFSGGSLHATAFGYFTFIKGVDDRLLFAESDPSKQNEATAFFTTFVTAKTTRMTKNGPLLIFEAETEATAYFNPTPHRDFSNPDSFKEGMLIGAGEQTIQFVFDTTTGLGTGVVAGKQMVAPPFMFHGELVQFGKERKITSFIQGKTMVLHSPTRIFGAGFTIQAG
jgi:hypothetical protein